MNEVKAHQAYSPRTRLPDFKLLKRIQDILDHHQLQQFSRSNNK